MAIEQTLVSTKNLLFTAQSTLTNIHTPIASSLSLKPQTFARLFSLCLSQVKQQNERLGFTGAVKCYNNNNGHYDRVVGPQYSRPSEIQWKKELCNSVQLIGIVAVPVQIKHLNSGKILGWSRLAIKKSPTDTTWINLTFWDELAHIAFQHVEKGQQIYVSGRLVSDTVENHDGKQQTYYKVVVQQLNFIERGFSSVALFDGDSNSTSPGRKHGNSAANRGSTEELWQAFFANPVDWWDNRKNKRNPNYPDFKHKDTGESLWIEGRYNPPWVKSQLAILDSKVESFHDQNASVRMNFMAGDDFTPF